MFVRSPTEGALDASASAGDIRGDRGPKTKAGQDRQPFLQQRCSSHDDDCPRNNLWLRDMKIEKIWFTLSQTTTSPRNDRDASDRNATDLRKRSHSRRKGWSLQATETLRAGPPARQTVCVCIITTIYF